MFIVDTRYVNTETAPANVETSTELQKAYMQTHTCRHIKNKYKF